MFENILGMVLLQLTIILGYLVIKYLLFRSQDSIEEGTDAPDENIGVKTDILYTRWWRQD
ncbi:MAG: hypothetical protein ACXABY_25800 [Candidatus Thorarchaeota archaeon]